jgi:hypothetical protein
MNPGNPLLADLHDGTLCGIASAGRTLSLRCANVVGRPVVLTVTDVKDLFATNFRMGNIVLSVMMFDSIGMFPRALLQGLAQSADDRFVDRYVERAKKQERPGKDRYLMLQSSYGCDIAVVFEGNVSTEATVVLERLADAEEECLP